MPNTQNWQGSINRPDVVYTVKAGDSLSKIAAAFYGDPMQYVRIAQANGLDPNRVLPVGTKLRVPQAGSVDAEGTTIEEVQVTAQRLPAPASPRVPAQITPTETVTLPAWLLDWRVWVGGTVLVIGLYLAFSDRK